MLWCDVVKVQEFQSKGGTVIFTPLTREDLSRDNFSFSIRPHDRLLPVCVDGLQQSQILYLVLKGNFLSLHFCTAPHRHALSPSPIWLSSSLMTMFRIEASVGTTRRCLFASWSPLWLWPNHFRRKSKPHQKRNTLSPLTLRLLLQHQPSTHRHPQTHTHFSFSFTISLHVVVIHFHDILNYFYVSYFYSGNRWSMCILHQKKIRNLFLFASSSTPLD
jgi:hypothetical protein